MSHEPRKCARCGEPQPAYPKFCNAVIGPGLCVPEERRMRRYDRRVRATTFRGSWTRSGADRRAGEPRVSPPAREAPSVDEHETKPRQGSSTTLSAGGIPSGPSAVAVNQYRPWEYEGITEVAYWERAFIRTRMREEILSQALTEIVHGGELSAQRIAERALHDVDAARTSPRTAERTCGPPTPPREPAPAAGTLVSQERARRREMLAEAINEIVFDRARWHDAVTLVDALDMYFDSRTEADRA